MTEQEFTERTKLTVSAKEFDAIHIMYLEAGQHIDKDAFCKDYKAHKDSLLLSVFYNQADRLKDKMDRVRTYIDSLSDFMVDQAQATSSPEIRQKAIEMLGIEEYLRRVIRKGYALWDADKAELDTLLQGHKKSLSSLI